MYRVEFIDRKGVRQIQEMVAASEEEIRSILKKDKKTCISIQKQHFSFGQPKIRKEEIIAAFTGLGDLIRSGQSLARAIPPVINSFPKESKFAAVLAHINSAVKEGRTFSQAMAPHQGLFGPEVITMIESGEASGKLGDTFLSTAEYIQTMSEVRGELMKKLRYPMFLIIGASISMLFNATIAIPKLLKIPMFKTSIATIEKEGGNEAKVMAIIKSLKIVVPTGMGLIAAIAIGCFVYYKTHQEECEKYLVKVPLLKKLMFYQSYYVSFQTMVKLMRVGTPLKQALAIAGRSNRMHTIREEFENAGKFLKQGQSFTLGFTSLDDVEQMMMDIAQSAERIADNMDRVAVRFRKNYIEATQKIAPKAFAFAMVVVGVVVLTLLISFGLPYSKTLTKM